MGATAALKLAMIHDHVRTVLAIELLCAAQGIDLRRPLTHDEAARGGARGDPRAGPRDDGRPPARRRISPRCAR